MSRIPVNLTASASQRSDGAMFNLKNGEIIAFDHHETAIIAHNQTEDILARLVHSSLTAMPMRSWIDLSSAPACRSCPVPVTSRRFTITLWVARPQIPNSVRNQPGWKVARSIATGSQSKSHRAIKLPHS